MSKFYNIPYLKYGRFTTTISLVSFILAIICIWCKGLNLSNEFTGGSLIQIAYDNNIEIDSIRSQLATTGVHKFEIQNFGSAKEFLIRVPAKDNYNDIIKNITDQAQLEHNNAIIKNVQYIGPEIGRDLFYDGIVASIIVCLGVIVYLSVRFEWRFALSAIIANLHDIFIVLGLLSLLQVEFSLNVLAAILAVFGYSVNESVVVFDRIRSNLINQVENNLDACINNAINRTMKRTIITHACTQMMVLSILFFGGASLHGFAITLTLGIVCGIYSSVLVASPLLLLFGLDMDHFIAKKRVIPKEEIVV
jgi:preprotein translocase subunit SecF